MATGISLTTAITIQSNNDIVITHSGPAENGKFSGWITHSIERNSRPLVSTKPIFDTAELAEAHMFELKTKIEALDLATIQ